MDTYGLLGEKLGHSLSPQIHNKIFKHANLDGEYLLFPTQKEDIIKLINKIRLGEIKGINVTIPYKLNVMKYLDGISEEAKYIGSVNTVCTQKGKLVGFNTDSFGFKKTLEINTIKIKDRNIAVLGTGGASKSVVYVTKSMGAKRVDLFSRTPKEHQKGYDELDAEHDYDVIINTTPVGMYPNAGFSPILKKCIGNAEAVVDIVYNPLETRLLSYAKQLGKQHVNGMYMLVAQAVKAQEIFNAIKIGDDVIKKIYNEITGDM